MAVKTYYLDMQEEEHFDFDVFTISCSSSIYRVVNAINNELSIALEFNELIEFSHDKGGEFVFPVYSYHHPELNIEFNLLPNETSLQPKGNDLTVVKEFDLFAGDIQQTVSLLPELSNVNYLLLVKGENRYLYNHTILEALKKTELLQLVKELFIEDLADKKSRSHLLF